MDEEEKELYKVFDFWDSLEKKRPKWLTYANYVTVMGSRAYKNHTEESDYDFYGFVIPPLDVVFPHTTGDIEGFGIQKNRFDQLQADHVPSEKFGEVDLTIYNIVKYFALVAQNNPNTLDSIFVPEDCILIMDNVGKMVRDARHIFLSDAIYHRFRGFAHEHMKKIKSRTRIGSRKANVDKFGYEVKDASNAVRVLLQANDFLFLGDADISANSKVIREVRSGLWSFEEFETFFDVNMSILKIKMDKGESVLPKYPDMDKIKKLLIDCLEESHGSLDKVGYNIYG